MEERPLQIDVLRRLRAAILRNVYQLDIASKALDGLQVSWLTRNILELDVWSIFCCISEENSKTFVSDGARDAIGLLNIPEHFRRVDTGKTFKKLRDSMIAAAKEGGIENPDATYTRVTDVASKVGVDDFNKKYMILSKFAHPTALVVVNPGAANELIDMFAGAGKMWAEEAIKIIDERLTK